MSSRLGIELGTRHLRAVRLDGSLRPAVRAAEVEWDGDRLEDAMDRLARELGAAGQVAIALDMPLVFAKDVPLPALPAAEKVRILGLEPERYFPVRGEELLLAARSGDQLVFAARENVVAGAVAAAARLGVVDRVEPAPHALARALHRLGLRSGTVVLSRAPRGALMMRLERGEVAGLRWLRGGWEAAVRALQGGKVESPLFVGDAVARDADGGASPKGPDAGDAPSIPATARRLPLPRGVAESFLVAYGAALGADMPLGETLVPADLARRITARRRRRTAVAAAALAAAAIFAVLSVDRAAANAAASLADRADSLSLSAERALALQVEREAMERREVAVAALAAGRADPLAALAALGQQLPGDAWLRSVRASGKEWQIDGYARDAALLVPLLEAAPEFENVRFLTATTTERVDTRSHERFSIAFRLAGTP